MQNEERQVAEAAASLTVKDLEWIQSHRMVPQAPMPSEKAPLSQEGVSEQEHPSQEESSQKQFTRRKNKRRQVEHEWPEVGTILEADYHGQHYEAEVIEAPRYPSGKAIKILTGQAAGKVSRSLSGAMIEATQKQREELGLGKKGVANGWRFWSVTKQPS